MYAQPVDAVCSTLERREELLERLRGDIAGGASAVPTPFGVKPLVYADFTASGRVLPLIEQTIATRVAPYYANTHSETAFTGRQTTRFREEARAAVRAAVAADDRHAVIFAGSGATGAIAGLVGALPPLDGGRAVVFLGPYEHHSNDLPWRESGALVVRIPLDDNGDICQATLEAELVKHADIPLRIGAFSAASNVTGVRSDMRALAGMLHRHGAYCFVDFAAAAPYVDMTIAESAPGAGDHFDALYFSPHKFVGGPGASGVLVADKGLFGRARPVVPGGGTVSYVTRAHHRYVQQIERREEAGTPNILGDIRAGLVCRMKCDLGVDLIEQAEARATEWAMRAWGEVPNIEILAGNHPHRLPIFSLVIGHAGRMLHPAFVVAVLNDLFGIQARAGCSCAGPYAHDILRISDAQALRYEALVDSGYPMFRPGWTRLGFHFLHDDATINYLIEAVRFVAWHAGELLSLYNPDLRTGRWHARAGVPVASVGFDDLCSAWWEKRQTAADRAPDEAARADSYAQAFEHAATILEAADHRSAPAPGLPNDLERDRWFAL